MNDIKDKFKGSIYSQIVSDSFLTSANAQISLGQSFNESKSDTDDKPDDVSNQSEEKRIGIL